ncbi:hypothetical protein HKX48_006146 [Thoreauomyces humboldtii]|nr:hypothetical protein HKX48_006146 [Thoreauomyces humboldtii]
MTYARTRSYVDDPELFAPSYVTESQRRKEEGLESSDEDEERREVKSIHELREAGEAKRIADEIDYLVGGLSNSEPLGVQRSSCLELCKKILARKFMENVRAHGFLPHLLEFTLAATDHIILAMTTFVYCGLLQDKRNLDHLALQPNVLTALGKALIIRDPLTSTLTSRFEKRLVADFKAVMASATFIGDILPAVSLKSIALKCIATLLSAKSLDVPSMQNQLHKMQVLVPIVEACSGLEAGTTDNSEMEISQSGSVISISGSHCIRILEFAVTADARNQALVASQPGFTDTLLQMAATHSSLAHLEQARSRKATAFVQRILSLLVNLTNSNPAASKAVGQSPWLSCVVRCAIVPNPLLNDVAVVADAYTPILTSPMELTYDSNEYLDGNSEQDGVDNFSIMMLAVALLANVAQHNAHNRDRIRAIDVSMQCARTPSCVQNCCCDARVSAVTCIASVVNQRLADEIADPNLAVLMGQTTMLLGFLITDNPQNRALALTNMTLHTHSFESVIEMLETFARVFERVASKPSTSPDTREKWSQQQQYQQASPPSLDASGDTQAVIAGLIRVFRGS